MQNSLSKYWIKGVLHSYSQVFFSQHLALASAILLVTFFSPWVGFCGLSAILFCNLLAHVLGFNKEQIVAGVYGFNALMLGLALGFRFQPSFPFLMLWLIAMLAVFFITAWLQASLGKGKLPFLSLPFLLSYWLVMLATPALTLLKLRQESSSLDALSLRPEVLFQLVLLKVDHLPLPAVLLVYFKTLSSTFFVQSVLGGIIIAIALFMASRIAFSLSLLGYFSAYFAYEIFGANLNDLTQTLGGANFIFFAIAIGGFFLIPNAFTYLTVVLLTPLLMLMLIGLNQVFDVFHLKAYTLSFTLLTLVLLYALHHRLIARFLYLVQVQYYSPEKTVYKYVSATNRLKFSNYIHFFAPFFGTWKVSQAYDGNITHLGDWSKALDFVITDEQDKTYGGNGLQMTDFYCYNKPVLAPADGYVMQIINHVDDNRVGEVDTFNNWGNSIIIKHAEGLYSQLSHLKKDSFKVSEGAWVTRGSILALCGSSGRSPEPHIHFQIQQESKVGAKTLAYPLASYLKQNAHGTSLVRYEVPKEGDLISNIELNPTLRKVFQWQPGKKFVWFNPKKQNELTTHEIFTDAWNRCYLYCNETRSYAYFVNDGVRIYFTDFEGDKSSLLFKLYLSCYSVSLGYYPEIPNEDLLPLIHFRLPVLHVLQDFVAPFYVFSKVNYHSVVHMPEESEGMVLSGQIKTSFGGLFSKQISFSLRMDESQIKELKFADNGKEEQWQCVYA